MRWWAVSNRPKRAKVVKKGYNAILGDFWRYFLYLLWALAHFLIILDIFIPLFTFFILFADSGANFMRQGWRLRTIMWGKKNFYYIYFIYKPYSKFRANGI